MVLVSVIIPTYNRASLISEALKSVLSQTYRELQIIVVDDGSNDNTEEVVSSFSDNRIQYYKRTNSGSPAKVRNWGMSKAEGDFLAFLDSDDIWMPMKIELQAQEFFRNPDILGVCTNFCKFPGPENIRFNLQDNIRISLKDELKSNIIATSSVMLRKEVLYTVGGFDEVYSTFAEDYELWLRILKSKDYSFLLLKEALLYYRVHEQGISYNNDYKAIIRKSMVLLDIYKKYENDHPDIVSRCSTDLLKKIKKMEILYKYQSGSMQMRELMLTDIPVLEKGKAIAKKIRNSGRL